ncbi:MAG TPA: hypothetical protein VMJ30_03385 [Gemmatimonadales bacterium]|nr:hypothetical protein [Gemmatimonadales bacterium]
MGRSLKAWLAPVTAVFAAGCGANPPTGASLVTIEYSVLQGDIGYPLPALDSMTYDNGHGQLVKITKYAGTGWDYTVQTTAPVSIEGHLFGHSSGPASARFIAHWTTEAGTFGDTVVVLTSSATHFHADIDHRAI